MGSLICTVELDKEKGGEETSVTQTESSVTVRCKDFEVVAEAGMKIESSGVALLKGAIVNVQGGLVNVG